MLIPSGLLALLVFILGTIFGSFLNVVIFRTGSGAGYRGRSKCLYCGKKLTARMLVPLLSFVFQRGRCAHCSGKLSWQYPLVEGALGLLFVAVMHVTNFSLLATTDEMVFFILDCAIWMILLAILVYDLKHKIIPDKFALIFALFAGAKLLYALFAGLIVSEFVSIAGTFILPWMNILAAPLIAIPFALLWFFSRGRAMGLGDAKLAWGMGWFLGLSGAFTAAVFSFWTAFFPSLILLFLPGKKFTMKSEIPFAPFLILGTLIVYVWGVDILRWSFAF